ncbi:hypothetical protein MNBD_GAMMA22-721 [hydrothermal vent metagenome]|uniref:Uncharacterized protein n=1 Tax=hydrothermal vent metagenome TaxID=652676 RepID=A0A3B1A5C9_9ZZZZ
MSVMTFYFKLLLSFFILLALNSCATEIQYLYLPGDYKLWQSFQGYGAREYSHARVYKPYFFYQETPQKNRTILIEYKYWYKYDFNMYINERKIYWQRQCKETMWKILQKGPKYVVYEWYAQECNKAESRHQLVKLMEGFDGLHRVSYSEKLKLDPKTRKEWLKIISSAFLTTEIKLYNGLNR